MFSNLVLVLVLFLPIFVESNDIMLGHATPFSKKIYSAIKNANPALWRRRDNIMVNAPFNDYINAIYITDLRSDKEGEAYIAAGGLGQKSVTISLKSPGILTEYKFSIEVYAESIHAYMANIGTPIGGLSGVGAYPSTYPVQSVSYPISHGLYPSIPMGGVYPHVQYSYGRKK